MKVRPLPQGLSPLLFPLNQVKTTFVTGLVVSLRGISANDIVPGLPLRLLRGLALLLLTLPFMLTSPPARQAVVALGPVNQSSELNTICSLVPSWWLTVAWILSGPLPVPLRIESEL